MTKLSTAARDLYAKIAGKEAAQAAAAAEIAELRKQAAWATGEERRQRLTGLAGQAQQLADGAAAQSSAIRSAVVDAAAAITRVHELAAAHNDQMDHLRAQLVGEGIPVHDGSNIPPSPADGGVAPVAGGIRIGGRTIGAVDADQLVGEAVAAGKASEPIEPDLTMVTTAPPVTGRFWKNERTGHVFRADTPPIVDANSAPMRELSIPEYLAQCWGLDLSELPAEVLAQLTDGDKARLATKLMGELDETGLAAVADGLLPRPAAR